VRGDEDERSRELLWSTLALVTGNGNEGVAFEDVSSDELDDDDERDGSCVLMIGTCWASSIVQKRMKRVTPIYTAIND
jgi:hypothetical protein